LGVAKATRASCLEKQYVVSPGKEGIAAVEVEVAEKYSP